MVFVFFPPDHEEVRLRFRAGFFPTPQVTDLVSGTDVAISDRGAGQECIVRRSRWQLAVLVEI